jgi:nucleoside-diphosphate-sugar epimerase
VSAALVTGATGLLGRHVVDRLLGSRWEVRALVRNPARAAWLESRGAVLVPGDLTDPESIHAAVSGCDGVIHAAARVSASGTEAEFHAGNVAGTRNVLRAAERAGARLVHVSSTAVYGESRYRHRPTVETDPLPRLPRWDRYGRSKQEAERTVIAARQVGRVRAEVVRPTVMYGPGDRQLAPRVGPLLSKGIFPLVGGGDATLTIVHASSVADACVRALESGTAEGGVYNIAQDFDVNVRDFVRLAGEGLGRRVPAPPVPVAAGRLAFAGLRVALRAVGRRDLAAHVRGTFHMLTRDNPFSSERAREELGWCPTVRPEVGIPAAFRSWSDRRGAGPRQGSVR